MSLTPSSSDHHWDRVSAKDNARVHNGHSYGGPVYNVHNYAPNQDDDFGAQERRERAWRASLLTWLTFAEIDSRRTQVKDAFDETYKWIFHDGNKTGFTEWLRCGDGIFWINGKPASGKSTLMKFIAGEPRLQKMLQEWTGSTPLVISSFWFWAAGTPLQRSLTGLYRSLLAQILKTDGRLYRAAFPDWEVKFGKVTPTMEMLSTAMKNLLGSEALSTNFFFIIDGLDEYERGSIGKAELAALILDMTKCSKVKCLLSSRPETPFRIAFRHFPYLRLETLTKPDILAYIEAKLWSNPTLREISATERRSIQDIGDFIKAHAEGVFLWVALVMNIALDGINNYEDFSAIRDRIMDLPPELDESFNHIMTIRIEHRHREEAFRYLEVALRFESEELDRTMDHIVLAGARQASEYKIACKLVGERQKKELKRKLSTWLQRENHRKEFANLLASRCQGLLECTTNQDQHSITFCHRTLFDYLNEREEPRKLLKSAVGSSFDADTAIMVGFIHKAWMSELDISALELTHDDLEDRRDARLDPQTSHERLEIMFYYVNTLAEECNGRDRSELVEAFARCSLNSNIEEIKQLLHRQSSAKVGIDLHPKICMLANAAYFGGILHLKSAISRYKVSGASNLTLMLYYGTKGIDDARYSRVHDDVSKQPDEFQCNLKACSVLLEHGANPAHDFHGLCPWRLAIESIGNTPAQEGSSDTHVAVAQLRLLQIFVQHATDARKFRGIVSQHGNFETVQMLVMKGTCCPLDEIYYERMQDCSCDKARKARSLISEILQLLCVPNAEERAEEKAEITTTNLTQVERRDRSGMDGTRRKSLSLYRKCRRFLSIK